MKPLTPQTEDRVKWEFKVQDIITELEENISHSDAQDICMAQDSLLDECWTQKLSAKETAKKVLDASTVKQPEPYNYYREQIERLTPSPEYGYNIQIRGKDKDANKTNWLQVNEDSAMELIEWLQRFIPDERLNRFP